MIHSRPSLRKRTRSLPLLLASIALVLLNACSGAAPNTTPSESAASPPAADNAAQAPVSGDADVTVNLPFLETGITSFDHAYWTSQLLISQGTIFEGLYGYDPELNVAPKVAESATPSEDNKVWTFKLRQDKKWSNGDPVTAHDFYASWMRFLSPELKDAPMWVGFLSQVTNAWGYKSGAASPEDVGIRVIDDYTIEVTLTQPNAALINLLPVTSSMPINAKSLEEHPDDWWDPQFAVFNGPYIVQAWVNGGDTTLARNPHYVGEGIGNVPTIILKPYADPNARIQAFENGDIHFTFLADVSQLQYARNNPDMQNNIQEDIQNLFWQGIQYNRAVDPGPWSDIRVRKAFAMSIDKQAITDQVLKGMAVPTDAFSGDPRVTENIASLPYDVDQAKQLLADAGFPDGQGFPAVNFLAPPANDARMPMIEAISKMWQDNLGVQVVIQNNEIPVYSNLQWSNYNQDIQPGFSTLGGPMNWFQPMDLLLNAGHIWWFMDYKPGGVAQTVEYDHQLDEVANLTAPGDWAELEQRANDAWAKRQEIIAQETNEWGENMTLPPTFKEQFDAIAQNFTEAADDAAKLTAYQNGLTLVLREEQSLAQYDNYTEENKQAQRLMIKLSRSPLDDAWDTVVEIQQLSVDSAWMVPIYNEKVYYVTDPRLSGIVLNKLSWGHIFQFQYLQWTEQ